MRWYKTPDKYFFAWNTFFEAIARGESVTSAAIIAGVCRQSGTRRVRNNLGMKFNPGMGHTLPGIHMRALLVNSAGTAA